MSVQEDLLVQNEKISLAQQESQLFADTVTLLLSADIICYMLLSAAIQRYLCLFTYIYCYLQLFASILALLAATCNYVIRSYVVAICNYFRRCFTKIPETDI